MTITQKGKEFTIKALKQNGEEITHTFVIPEDSNPSDYYELGELLHSLANFRNELL
jgi:hypothetical protein